MSVTTMGSASVAAAMGGVLRLFWIEVRRSAGMWCFPFLVALAWLATRGDADYGVVLWSMTSRQIASSAILMAPVAAGLAAWAAGRDARRGVDDLLRTTPRPAVHRDLAALGASVLWVALACLALGGYLAVQGYRGATWGGPIPQPILIGSLTLLVGAAIGYAVGSWLPSRFAPPLVAVAVFLALAAPTAAPYEARSETGRLIPSGVHFLTPFAITGEVDYSVFRRASPDIAGRQALGLLGLGGVALAAIALRRRPSRFAWGGLLGSLATVGVATSLLLTVHIGEGAPIPYTPACVQRPGSVEVCFHPAYRAELDDTAAVVDAVMAPLVGVPGTPARFEQGSAEPGMSFRFQPDDDGQPGGTAWITPINVIDHPDGFAQSLVLDLVWDSRLADQTSGQMDDAQAAVALWLMRQAGYEAAIGGLPAAANLDATGMQKADDAGFAERQASIEAAVARFAALGPAAQRAWLAAHWSDLRAGRLTLEDLP